MQFFLEIHDKVGKQINGDSPEEIETKDLATAMEIAVAAIPGELPVYEIHLWVAEP